MSEHETMIDFAAIQERVRSLAEGPEPAPAWMVVELLGHNRHAGVVTEEVRFGGTINRVDDLQPDGTTVPVYFGHAAIFRITPATEESVRRMVGHRAAGRALPLALPPARREDDLDEDDEEDDDFDDDDLDEDDDIAPGTFDNFNL